MGESVTGDGTFAVVMHCFIMVCVMIGVCTIVFQ
jgi:hypothetical protein